MSKRISKVVALISVATLLTGFSPTPGAAPATVHTVGSVDRASLALQQEELPEAPDTDEEDTSGDINSSGNEDEGSSHQEPGTEEVPNDQDTVPNDDEVPQDTQPERQPLSVKPFKTGGSPFKDVPTSHQFFNEILWMHDSALSTGWRLESGTYFRPKSELSREAMAAFMYRKYAPNGFKAPARSPFTDVPTNHKFYKEISWMYSAGLSTGWSVNGKREYRPQESITRDAMAAFLFRQLEPDANWRPKLLPFTDVYSSTKFSREIAWMFESGRSTGFWNSATGTRQYRPLDHLTREATAAFLFRSESPTSPPEIGSITGKVTLSGTGKLGEKLTANTSSLKPSGTALQYQWLRNNKNISGATKSTYTPTNADLSQSIAVKVTISKAGYNTRSVTSEKKTIVPKQVTGKDFVPSNIISDAKMFDGQAMTVAEIQAFLESKIPKCAIGTPNYKAGTAFGNSKIATHCLPQMRFDSPGDPISDQCAAYAPTKNETAAQIIYKVGKGCGVSQKALLVMLQKEQGLITDTWPTDRQFDIAMGYGCYDTGPNYSANCNPTYVGFYEQVSWAAYQLKRYKNVPNRYNHYANKTSSVLYHPNPDCNSIRITMANAATAGLYNYTPYVPNSAALNAGFGTGNSCSSYGNRNFFLYYNQWFGSSQ